MENIFETIAEIVKPDTYVLKVLELKNKLFEVNAKIAKIEGVSYYTDKVEGSFHLGMVGGSGRNTYRLNKRREADLDKTIKNAVLVCPLYRERDNIERQINDIESGAAQKKELSVIDKRVKAAEYWRNLKVGDELNIGNSNGNPIIKKKNRLSVETTTGCKWMASEVIGKQAAKLI